MPFSDYSSCSASSFSSSTQKAKKKPKISTFITADGKVKRDRAAYDAARYKRRKAEGQELRDTSEVQCECGKLVKAYNLPKHRRTHEAFSAAHQMNLDHEKRLQRLELEKEQEFRQAQDKEEKQQIMDEARNAFAFGHDDRLAGLEEIVRRHNRSDLLNEWVVQQFILLESERAALAKSNVTMLVPLQKERAQQRKARQLKRKRKDRDDGDSSVILEAKLTAVADESIERLMKATSNVESALTQLKQWYEVKLRECGQDNNTRKRLQKVWGLQRKRLYEHYDIERKETDDRP